MTTDYDRISADDLSCQTEDRLDHTEGDRVRIDTATGNEDTLAKLGLAVADNGAHTNITSTDGSEVYMILENIDHASITDASFITYFDIV